MKFEWDENKAASNLAKHGVSFEDASIAINDPFSIQDFDADNSVDEDRLIISGMCRGFILQVVITERNDTWRIISARRASKREQENYYRQNAP
jgi:uncharacterized protein